MTLRVAVIGISAGLVVACAAWPAWAYQEAQVTGGGTIKGKVVYNGEIPIRTVVPTKDQQVCGGVREEPEVKVSADNGVGDAIVYLKEVEQGKAWPAARRRRPWTTRTASSPRRSRRSRPGSSTSTTPIRSCTTRTASTAGGPPSTSLCPIRVRPSRSTCRARDRSGSSATPMAGCSAGSTRSPIRTTR